MTVVNAKDPNGDAEGWVQNTSDLLVDAMLMGLVNRAGELLEKAYPGWMWCIEPDQRGGIINVSSMRFPPVNGKRPGFTLHTYPLSLDPQMAKVKRYGGELLERFGCRRGAYDSDNWMAVQRASVAKYGAFVPDVSDKSRAEQRSIRADTIREGMRTGRARVLTDADLRGSRAVA